MSKLWKGEVRKIIVYQRGSKEAVNSFLADDAKAVSPYNYFFLDGKEINYYDERRCYYKSYPVLKKGDMIIVTVQCHEKALVGQKRVVTMILKDSVFATRKDGKNERLFSLEEIEKVEGE